jgi:hypothetical protein
MSCLVEGLSALSIDAEGGHAADSSASVSLSTFTGAGHGVGDGSDASDRRTLTKVKELVHAVAEHGRLVDLDYYDCVAPAVVLTSKSGAMLPDTTIDSGQWR